MEIISIINFTAPSTSNTFAKLIMWLVSITSSVALGVVLFTLFLKLITLPFDFMSRFSMRKNSIKMEQMRPELEKLQQQYAGNKELYNQKMMALYKKNGYSMFGACLPTIVTLVIFIIAINGFNAYSHYQNKQYFYEMSVAYNNVIYSGLQVDGEYIYIDDDGAITVNDEKILEKAADGDISFTPDGKDYQIIITKTATEFTVTTTDGYVEYKRGISDGKPSGSKSFKIISENLNKEEYKSEYNNNLLNTDKKTFTEIQAEITAEEFLSSIGSLKAAERFKNNGSRFLWVKNIWVTDSPMKHPVETVWKTFQTTYGYSGNGVVDIGEDGYKKLIAGLTEEQTAPNGYLILVILTAGSSLLMQLVMSKSQKAQMELQTVDGQGAQTQKIMTWMMPIMMAVFAFMYTAAFSIYIILSSIISLLTTLLINVIADRKFKPKTSADGEVIHGRIYVPKEEEKPVKNDKKAKNKNKIPENDFLSGIADKKKHPRGRVK